MRVRIYVCLFVYVLTALSRAFSPLIHFLYSNQFHLRRSISHQFPDKGACNYFIHGFKSVLRLHLNSEVHVHALNGSSRTVRTLTRRDRLVPVDHIGVDATRGRRASTLSHALFAVIERLDHATVG